MVSDPTSDPCDICGLIDLNTPDFRVNVAGAFAATVCSCPTCGFRQLRPRPRTEDLVACYADDYFDSEGGTGFADYAKQRQRHHRDAWFLGRQLRRLSPRGQLLEVGCALGFMLEGLRRYCDWELTGLDVSGFGVRFASERLCLNARAATLAATAFPSASFDYIVQKDLIEHVENPREHLLETARVLRPGGRTWLVTPNGEANLAPLRRLSATTLRERPELLPLLDQAHVSFFTRENLLRLFDECGFRVLRLRSISVKRGLRALGHLPARRQPPFGPADPRKRSAMDRVASFDALADRMVADLARYYRSVRDQPAYFLLRQAQDWFDSLPGHLAWGNDFDCLLEKR